MINEKLPFAVCSLPYAGKVLLILTCINNV